MSDSDDSSSSAEADVIEAVVLAAPYLRSLYAKEPRNTSALQGSEYFKELIESSNETRFYDMAHMRLETFFLLLTELEGTGKLGTSARVSSGEKLMLLLRVLVGTTNRTSGERWQHSGSTISLAVREVLRAIESIQSRYIKPTISTVPAQIASNPKFYPYFADCIGALDGTHINCTALTASQLISTAVMTGTHIPAIVTVASAAPFRNRKGFISQNVLGVCDFDMRFTYILVGWEGSAHDGRVLSDALQHGFPLVEGKYYLADAGYSLTPNTLTPYRGVRYHLKEWETGNQRPQTKEELFNLRHSMLRNVIERSFGVIKRKFPLLRAMLPYPFDIQVKLVIAAFTIHNFIRESNEKMGPLDRADIDVEEGTPQDANSECVDSENSQMKTYRDSIALQMWNDYILYLAERDNTVVV
jgi:hypothetical protein